MQAQSLNGAGLGLRRDIVECFLDNNQMNPKFVELAPENWMSVGGRWGRVLKAVAERYPITCHGLSLSLGSPEELDWDFVDNVKKFLDDFGVQVYSEHLSYCKCDNAHLYDLLPIPFCEEAVKHVADRIRKVQQRLDRKIAIENVSYYTPIAPQMDEATFIRAVAEEADCNLLLDVNNVYVNAFNHRYDAKSFIKALPLERVSIVHMAGHEQKSADLIIDTHGQPIIDPVFELFNWTLDLIKPVPVLLERDYNFEDLVGLTAELQQLQNIIDRKWMLSYAA